jgi:hypothetical protein
MEDTKKEGCIIYGIDTCAIVTPLMVRDAIVSCFTEAHAKELNELREFGTITDEEFEKMKEMNIRTLIENTFRETGGDFENPTKESLSSMVEKLAEFARNFRDQKVVEEHYQNISKLIGCLT